MLLAADIGGTKSHVAVCNADGSIAYDAILPSKEYFSFEALLTAFFCVCPYKKEDINNVSIAAAGYILSGICHITNISWNIEKKSIISFFNTTRVYLQNDVVANLYGAVSNKSDNTLLFGSKPINPQSMRSIISAGTGLGIAYGESEIFPTEGGHIGFSPKSRLTCKLYSWLSITEKHVSYEHILSGNGFIRLYDFLVLSEGMERCQEVEACCDVSAKICKISSLGAGKKNETCEKVVFLFIWCYGALSSDIALLTLPFAGLYIGGGIAPKIDFENHISVFKSGFFSNIAKKEILNKVSIYLIKNKSTALNGAIIKSS